MCGVSAAARRGDRDTQGSGAGFGTQREAVLCKRKGEESPLKISEGYLLGLRSKTAQSGEATKPRADLASELSPKCCSHLPIWLGL